MSPPANQTRLPLYRGKPPAAPTGPQHQSAGGYESASFPGVCPLTITRAKRYGSGTGLTGTTWVGGSCGRLDSPPMVYLSVPTNAHFAGAFGLHYGRDARSPSLP